MAKKAKKPKGYVRNKAFWVLVYITLGLLVCIGVALIVRQYVLIPTPYTPPDPGSVMEMAAPTPAPTLPPEETAAPTPEPTPYIKMVPIRIYFDNHELQADIETVGLLEDNSIDTVPSATIAGWFDQGASPGDPGNAIISGHVAWKGKKGTFSVLHDMEKGEQVTVEFENGSLRYFEVVSKNSYEIANFPSFVTDLDGDTRLTLITCLGDYDRSIGTSRTRVVVECEEKRELRRDIPITAESAAGRENAEEGEAQGENGEEDPDEA